MAGVNVIYDEAKFTWAYTPGTTPATELRLKWGIASGSLTNVKTYGVNSTTDLVKNVMPGPGQYYAQMVAANAKGEGVASAVLPFVAGSGLPDGSINFSIG